MQNCTCGGANHALGLKKTALSPKIAATMMQSWVDSSKMSALRP
jgi:hypothetical protein